MENKPLPQCVVQLHKPSQRELAFFFVSGVVVSFPFAYFFESFGSFYPSQLTIAILIIVLGPFIEELAKVFPLFYRHGETERSLVTIGLLIGLGFGVAELIDHIVLGGLLLIVRIPAVVFHASSATITAYGIAKKNPLPYYMIAVSLHVANNFFAVSGADILSISAILLILITVYLLAQRYYRLSSKEKIVV